jgi:molecular chaperone DnaJ
MQVKKKDFYKILGIEKNASQEEIKKKYYKKAKEFHPDLNKSPDTEEKFKELAEAYEVLSDPEKRRQYDIGGTFVTHPKGWNPFDIFHNLDMIFKTKINFEPIGAVASDINIDLEISLKESYCGANKTIKIKKRILCDKCGGIGGKKEKCKKCNGVGKIIEEINQPGFSFRREGTCDACFGHTELINEKCEKCEGTGTQWERREINIKILPEYKDNSLIKISGMGDQGLNGVGNLLLRLKIKPYKNFKRINDMLFYEKDIEINDLLKGAQHDIILPDDGKITVEYDKKDFITLPVGYQIFQKIIKEKGFVGGELIWTGKLIL